MSRLRDLVADRLPRVFRSPAARRQALVRAGLLVAVVAAVTVAVAVRFPAVTDPDRLGAFLAALGPYAPAAFVALQTAQVILAPLPGQVLGGVGGFLFGTLWGSLYSLLGVTLGSVAVFLLSRRYGRPYAERVVEPETLRRWDEFLGDAGLAGLFVLFLLPTFPDDVLCLVVGLSELRLRTLVVLVVFGRGPSFLAVAYAGTQAAGGQYTTTLAVLTALGIASAVVYAGRDQIVAVLGQQ